MGEWSMHATEKAAMNFIYSFINDLSPPWTLIQFFSFFFFLQNLDIIIYLIIGACDEDFLYAAVS